MWPDRRLLELFDIEYPILQAPMAGAMDSELAIAAIEGGALGSLPCAMLSADQIRGEVGKIRARTNKAFNLNFFCHTPPARNEAQEAKWRERLAPYYAELGVDPSTPSPAGGRAPFDEATCALLEELKPAVASFHFGLPSEPLVRRVKAAGCIVMGSATTVAEARWLEAHGADVIIAQGAEAGGHRGMFLTDDIGSQVGTFSLVPQVVDAVRVPVVATGGIADARGIVAALALGGAGVQIGTAYLFCPESKIAKPHRAHLSRATDDGTTLTNVITGRPARGINNRIIREIGPIAAEAPAFPLASAALLPLRAKAEAQGSGDFSPMWSGQSASLGREMPARDLTRLLAEQAQARLGALRA